MRPAPWVGGGAPARSRLRGLPPAAGGGPDARCAGDAAIASSSRRRQQLPRGAARCAAAGAAAAAAGRRRRRAPAPCAPAASGAAAAAGGAAPEGAGGEAPPPPPPPPPQSRTPKHPAAMRLLFAMYLCNCLVERTWRFGLPLVLAYLEGGYRAIAVLGFVSPLATGALGPAVGRALDRAYRPYGLGAALAVQGGAIIASGLVVLLAAAGAGGGLRAGSPAFGALLLFSAAERLTAIASELAIERDWVTRLAGKDNARALSSSNAWLRRSDLSCELVGALAFGWLYSRAGLAPSVAAVVAVAAVAVPLQLYFIFRIARLAPGAMLHGRAEARTALFKPRWRVPGWGRGQPRGGAPAPAAAAAPLLAALPALAAASARTSLDGWRTYFKQPILPSSAAFVLLFFNVSLSPGGLITAFLASWGVDGTGMAAFKGGCATMGFLGTWVGRAIIERYGLVRAGARALAIQGVLLGAAVGVYLAFLSGPLPAVGAAPALPGGLVGGVPAPVAAFGALVVASRVGMWAFDMVNAQLFQQTVPQREVAGASSAEMALCSVGELAMLGLAAYVVAPGQYARLVLASFGAVLAANAVYGAWARHQDTGGHVAAAIVRAA